MKFLTNITTRKYIYRVATAVVPLLILMGVMVPGISEVVLLLIASVLGLGTAGLAAANTQDPTDEEPSEELGEQ